MHGSLLFSSLVNFGFSALLVAPFFPFPPPLEGPGAAFTAADEEVPPWPLESSLLGSSFFSFLGFGSFFNLSFGSLSGFLSGLSAFAGAAAGFLSLPPVVFKAFSTNVVFSSCCASSIVSSIFSINHFDVLLLDPSLADRYLSIAKAMSG